MKNLKDIEKELICGKNVEQVLPMALIQIATNIQMYAKIQLSIQYYNLYDSIADKQIKLTEAIKPYLIQVNEIVGQTIESFNGEKRENGIIFLDSIRKNITTKMDYLTSLKDIFSLYEYIFNRLEGNFEENQPQLAENDEIAKELLRYIFEKNDNVIINQRIKSILSQLPVRMTKNKFLDLLKNSLNVYEGTEKDTLDQYLYLLKSVTGLRRLEGIEQTFPDLWKSLIIFEKCKFDTLDAMQFQQLSTLLKDVSKELLEEIEVFYQLQEVVNSLYAYLLTIPYASPKNDLNQLTQIIRLVYLEFIKGIFRPISEENIALFHVVEGKIEQLTQQIEQHEAIIEVIARDYQNNINTLMLDKLFECLKLAQKLLSDSIFIEFDCVKDNSIVDKNSLNQIAMQLQNDFSLALEKQPKEMRRAVTAAAISAFPVFFSCQNEVMDYIRGTLSSCNNLSEKAASVELLYKIMKE